MDVTYLDNNATTKPCAEAVAAMRPYFEEFYGNPSSVHRFGQRARQAIDEARAQIAGLVKCLDSELLLTAGGTESINTAIRSMVATRAPRRRVITSTVEHSATRELCHRLAREGGVELVEVGVDSGGRLDLEQLAAELSDEVALVSLILANNETGVIWEAGPIVELCRRHKVPVHLDGTQAVGKVAVDLSAMGADAFSFASHKFHGPKGVGGLYLRKGLRFRPWLIGGPQERDRRGGTENVAGIVGMGAAAVAAGENLSRMAGEVAGMRDELERAVLEAIPDASVNGDVSRRLPNTTNISFHQLEAEAILLLLSEKNICASAGAACSSGSLEPSHVLKAMNINPAHAHGAIRFSLSRFTTRGEIEVVMGALPGIIQRLRKVLPVG